LVRDANKSDPGARAHARLTRRLRAHHGGRIGGSVALAALGVALVASAEPITGAAGATVGAVVGALLLCGLGVALWPWRWSPAEHQHRQLSSIWDEVRADAREQVPWARYAAWAEAGSESVHLQLLRSAPGQPRAGGAPSPFSRTLVRRVDAEDVEAAAEAMEALRAEASELERQAQERRMRDQVESERRQHEARLAEIERATASAIKAGEEQARRELAEQQAADRRAQADAVAQALRRP
jgi:flagellar biosynthesis GTPase FlhF